MRLLLVGDSSSAVPMLLRMFAENAPTVTCCADASQALAALLEARCEFDWVVLAGSGVGDETRFAALATELDRPMRIGVLGGTNGARPFLAVLCAVRKSAGGVHFFRCALDRPGVVQIHQETISDEEGSIVEYHAPYRRGGKPSSSALTVWSPVANNSARKRRALTKNDMRILRNSGGRGDL